VPMTEVDRLRANDVVLVLTPPELSLVVDRFFSRRFKSTATHLRREHGDFIVNGSSRLEDLARAYDLPIGGIGPGLTVDQLLKRRIGPIVGRGDRLRLGPVELIIIDMIGEVKEVGVLIRDTDDRRDRWPRWPRWLRPLLGRDEP